MRFPHGISDFHKISSERRFYVDRTDRIARIEDGGDQLLLLRPRRFGKSLWLSTLENYYDLAKADQFEQLFGHLKIGQAPTARHNSYFIMKWNFSLVDPMGAAACPAAPGVLRHRPELRRLPLPARRATKRRRAASACLRIALSPGAIKCGPSLRYPVTIVNPLPLTPQVSA